MTTAQRAVRYVRLITQSPRDGAHARGVERRWKPPRRVGFLDFTTAPVAEAASIDAERVRGLFALDLRGLTFMDPTGPP